MRGDPRVQKAAFAALPALVAVLVAAVLSAPATAAPVPVTITGSSVADYAFAPATVKIAKGGSVRWTWDGLAPHNVTFPKLGKASPTAASGDYRRRFKKAGTYRYVCTVHGFKGKVVVKATR